MMTSHRGKMSFKTKTNEKDKERSRKKAAINRIRDAEAKDDIRNYRKMDPLKTVY